MTSPTKPLQTSTMTHEENEEICNHLSNLEAKFKELNARSVTHVPLVNTTKNIEIELKNMANR